MMTSSINTGQVTMSGPDQRSRLHIPLTDPREDVGGRHEVPGRPVLRQNPEGTPGGYNRAVGRLQLLHVTVTRFGSVANDPGFGSRDEN